MLRKWGDRSHTPGMKDMRKTSDKSTGKQGRQGQVLWDGPKAQKEEGPFTTDGTRENTHRVF